MNRVVLVGRLVKDPELKRTTTDIPVVQFTIAVNRQFAGQNGERQADFISCVVWRAQAENLAKYQHKGNLIGVEGRLQVRTYEDAGGVKRYVTEVVCDQIQFLETKGAREGGYGDVNGYDIPSAPRQQVANDPFAGYGDEPSDPLASLRIPSDSKRNDSDPLKNLKTSLDIAEDDLPF